MEYTCQHCGANLEKGDIFQYFFLLYKDHTQAMTTAKLYGYSETNQIHFNRSIIIQDDISPDCNEKYPFKKIQPQ